jgi:hypothetical protein
LNAPTLCKFSGLKKIDAPTIESIVLEVMTGV